MNFANIEGVKSKQKPFISETGEEIYTLVGPEVSGLEKHSVAYVEIPVGKTSPAHYHKEFEESYYIISGKGHFVLDGEEKIVEPGDMFPIRPPQVHQIFNDSKDEVLTLLVTCAPAWHPNDMWYPE